MSIFPNAVWQLLLGFVSGLLVLATFWGIGRAIEFRSASDNSNPWVRTAWGTAIYVVICWYGVRLGFRIDEIFAGVVVVFGSLLLFRLQYVSMARAEAEGLYKAMKRDLPLVAFYFAVASSFRLPYIGANVPLAQQSNLDIFNYVASAAMLLRGETSSVVGYDFLRSSTYDQTPALFYLLGAMAVPLSGNDHLWGVIKAAMPALNWSVALSALAIYRIGVDIMKAHRAVAAAVAALGITGSFFQYIAGNYFFAQIVSMGLFLCLVLTSMRDSSIEASEWRKPLSAIARSPVVPIYVLLLFSFPATFFVLVLIHIALLTGRTVSNAVIGRSLPGTSPTKLLILGLCIPGLALLATALVDVQHFVTMVARSRMLASVALIGWPLPMILPTAVLGLPGPMTVSEVGGLFVALSWFASFAGFAALFVQRVRRGSFSPEQLTVTALTALLFVLYVAYYLIVGPSYQQWKFAASFPLALAPVMWFMCATAARPRFDTPGSIADRFGSLSKLVLGASILVVTINVAQFHLDQARTGSLVHVPTGDYRALTAVGSLTSRNTILFDMKQGASAFLPVALVSGKKLEFREHPYYFPVRKTGSEEFGPDVARFVEGAKCEPGAGQGIQVGSIGCLFEKAPLLKTGTEHRFSDVLPFSTTVGLGAREPWGRWSVEDEVLLTLYLDKPEVEGYGGALLLLKLHPYVVGQVKQQDVKVKWGRGREKNFSLKGPKMLVFEVDASDLGSDSSVAFKFNIPTAVSPRAADPPSQDPRRLGVGFGSIQLMAPGLRTLPRDRAFRMNEELPFLDADGLNLPEPWGTWSEGESSLLKLKIDPSIFERSASYNVLFTVVPYLPTPNVAHRVAISWGAGRDQSTMLTARRTLSLPITRNDLDANNMLSIAFSIPTAISPNSVDPKSTDRRKLGVGFESVQLIEGS